MIYNALFMLLYALLFGAFLFLMRALRIPYPSSIPPLDFLLLAFSTFRITELITLDSITRFLRDPFVKREKVVEPGGDVEEVVKPAGRGWRKAFGKLIICPWCVGVWVGTFLTYFYLLTPNVARVFLLAFGATGAGIIIELFAKALDRASDKD